MQFFGYLYLLEEQDEPTSAELPVQKNAPMILFASTNNIIRLFIYAISGLKGRLLKKPQNHLFTNKLLLNIYI